MVDWLPIVVLLDCFDSWPKHHMMLANEVYCSIWSMGKSPARVRKQQSYERETLYLPESRLELRDEIYMNIMDLARSPYYR